MKSDGILTVNSLSPQVNKHDTPIIPLFGNTGDDEVLGGLGNDTIFGGLGNDWMDGGEGFDILNGGQGQDVYAFSGPVALNNQTQISSFNASDDTLDISELLTGYDSQTDDINDFVRIFSQGILEVDPNGQSGGTSFTQVGVFIPTTPSAGTMVNVIGEIVVTEEITVI